MLTINDQIVDLAAPRLGVAVAAHRRSRRFCGAVSAAAAGEVSRDLSGSSASVRSDHFDVHVARPAAGRPQSDGRPVRERNRRSMPGINGPSHRSGCAARRSTLDPDARCRWSRLARAGRSIAPRSPRSIARSATSRWCSSASSKASMVEAVRRGLGVAALARSRARSSGTRGLGGCAAAADRATSIAASISAKTASSRSSRSSPTRSST